MTAPDGFQGFRCYCGEWVSVVHAECATLRPPEPAAEEASA